jgi:hypothetical protein
MEVIWKHERCCHEQPCHPPFALCFQSPNDFIPQPHCLSPEEVLNHSHRDHHLVPPQQTKTSGIISFLHKTKAACLFDLSAFGRVVPSWLLSVGRWTFESVSNVALRCFCFFQCFSWETHADAAGGCFQIWIPHKSRQKKNDESENHDLPKSVKQRK